MIRKALIIIGIILTLSSMGCTPTRENGGVAGVSQDEMIKFSWKLSSISGNRIEKGNITLSFLTESKSISGVSVINSYFGNYTRNGKNIKISISGLTKMAGPEEDMELEQKYIRLLEDVTTIEESNNEMILRTEKEELKFVKQNN